MSIPEVASMATGLAKGAEVAKVATTVAEAAKPAAGLANTLEAAAAVNPHQAIANLAGTPNLILDAKGTEVFIPPIAKAPVDPNIAPPVEGVGKGATGLEGTRVAERVAEAAKVETPGVPKPQAETTTPQAPAGKVEAQQPGQTQAKPEAAPQQQGDGKKPEAAATTPQQTTEQGKLKTETSTTAQKTEGADAKAKTAEAQQQRTTELQGKIKNGTATEDELKEYRGLKKQEDPEVRRQALEKKILDGDFTDAEAAEWKKLSSKGEAGKENPQKPKETEAEQIKKEMEELGVKILRGDGDRAENMAKLQQLRDKADGLKPQMLEERAKQLVNSVLNPDKSTLLKTAKEIAIQREIKAKLEQLMALEMQVLMAPQRLEALKRQGEQIKGQIAAVERETQGMTDMSNEQTFKKRMDRYSLYMQLTNVKAAMVQTRAAVPILIGQYKDTMQYVRRKLGVTHGFTAFLEWADAKLNKTAVDLYVDGVSLADMG